MSDNEPVLNDEVIEAEIISEFQRIKEIAKNFSPDEVKNGNWFLRLLNMVVGSSKNLRADYFFQKYPGISRDEIADKLISSTVRYAVVAGGISGVATSANQFTILASAGASLPLFISAIGTEILYLAWIQMRLIFELAALYDLQLDTEDPEDVLLVFGYALGVAPTDAFGKFLQTSANVMAKDVFKAYFSKGTLQTIQRYGRRIGVKILQRSILKYGVPVVSVAVGSSYNYVTTNSIGTFAKIHFKNRGQVTEELRQLVSRQITYELAFPAAVMYMAKADGKISSDEMAFYKGMLSRMSFEEHSQQEAQKLINAKEETILSAIAGIEDAETRQSLFDTLTLIAIADGELAEKEKMFLSNVAEQFNILFDLEEIKRKAEDFNTKKSKSWLQRTRTAATTMTENVKGVSQESAKKLSNLWKRNDEKEV